MRAVLVAVGCALGSWALSACRTADVAPPDVYVDYDQRARLPDGGAHDAVSSDVVSSDAVTTDAQSSDAVSADVVTTDVVTTDAVTTDAVTTDAVSSDVSTPDVSVDVISDASADTSSVTDAGPGDGATD